MSGAPASGGQYEGVFDGGSLGNPGVGYGSYRVRVAGGDWGPPRRLEFGDRVTNNEAEYRALIAALADLAASCGDPSQGSVRVYGDSRLVLLQLKGEWKVRATNLRPLYVEARGRAGVFRSVEYVWQPRDESVALLGH
jgi:probable phosphoglycerate mutase